MNPSTSRVFVQETQGRPAVQIWGRRAMASSAHPEATHAALDVLRAGGNAVDAAIALASTIAVTNHNLAGIAGDSAWLIYWATTGELRHLDGYSTCPKAMTPEVLMRHFDLDPVRDAAAFREEPANRRDAGLVTSTVPGTPAAWYEAWQRYGSKPFDGLLERAVGLARDGLPVIRYQAGSLRASRDMLARYPASRRIFFGSEDEILGEGDTLVQEDLAATLSRYAADPENEFYRGETAHAIVAWGRDAGAVATLDDFDGYTPVWRPALESSYRGHRVVAAGPPAAGIHVLQALNILETFALSDLEYHSPQSLHLLIEATKLALADRRGLAGDPDFVTLDVEALLDKGYAARRAAMIEPERAVPAKVGACSTENATTHFVVRDTAGNVVSATQSIGGDFGAGEVVDGTGLVMNDRTWWMALADSPNMVAPLHRANIGHAPTIVFAGGEPWIALGSPGGFGIVQYVLQVLVNVIDYGFDIQSAIEAPRFRIEDLDRTISLESRIADETLDTLRRWGYDVTAFRPWTDCVGGVEAVAMDSRTGNILGGHDPRRNSLAAGF